MIIEKFKYIVLILLGSLILCMASISPAKAVSVETRNSSACRLDKMTCIYLDKTKCTDENDNPAKSDAPDSADSCWYCKIVIILVNAYLKVAKDAMGITMLLGRTLLKFGFLIWLAFYILQQVSSLEQITPGKMLQEILVMMFKVALAYLLLEPGTNYLVEYYVNPIVSTGVDYGNEIFDRMPKPNS